MAFDYIESCDETRFVSDPRRKAPRKAVCMMGEISTGDRKHRLGCRIVDISATGARLSLRECDQDISRIKKRVGLYFDYHLTNVECQVIWQRGGEMGVQFCSQFHHGR